MTAFLIEQGGAKVELGEHTIGPDIGAKAQAAKLSVRHYVNQMFPNADLKVGAAYDQILASCGLTVTDKRDNMFGLRDATVAEILDGTYHASNVKDNAAPFGTAARSLFPYAVIDLVESKLKKDYETDSNIFASMVSDRQSIAGENFEQPVISYDTPGGPEQAKAQRIAQFAMPPRVLRFSTSDRLRRLPTYGIMMEFSQQALRATTLDTVALVAGRYLQVEKDERVYRYLSSLWVGDGDLVTGAVPAVTSNSLDSNATGGVLTHLAWLKFLARNRKYRTITHIVCDIDTYHKITTRPGRPGSNNYDPTLARIDPQVRPMNVSFGDDVKWFITDPASEGGPVPANTVWALDATNAITLVQNINANYAASEAFALKRSESMVMHWSEEVYRTMGDSDLRSFDVLTIS